MRTQTGAFRLCETSRAHVRWWQERKSKARRLTPGVSLRPQSTVTLLSDDLHDLQVGIGVVPLGGDVFEGEAEGFGLAGKQGRQVEIDGFVVGTAGAEDVDGQLFFLSDLTHVVFECDLDDGVNDSLIASVGDLAVEIADGCSGKVLRGAGFEIGKFEIGGVGRGLGRLFLPGAEDEHNRSHNYQDDEETDQDGSEGGFCRLGGGIEIGLEQGSHGGDCTTAFGVRHSAVSYPLSVLSEDDNAALLNRFCRLTCLGSPTIVGTFFLQG